MKVDFAKYADGLVPAVIQDFHTQKVLMLGFMNAEALPTNRTNRSHNFLQPHKKTPLD
jgi:phosphoribosyl-ATP pyrophosphohydrolase/phosphoribosyl-AMP cyclohydrolase